MKVSYQMRVVLDSYVLERLKAHMDKCGIVMGKFVGMAIAEKLERENESGRNKEV